MKDFTAVILAAGEGIRMKSDTPKVMHKICGQPMLSYVIGAARQAGAQKIVVIVGKGADLIKEAYANENVEFVLQKEQKGTGHALMQAEDAVKESSQIVVLYGDMPLVSSESIKGMIRLHQEQNAVATVMTAKVQDPTGYGRIIRRGNKVIDIREHRDASPEERMINEINAGFYCFDTEAVFRHLPR